MPSPQSPSQPSQPPLLSEIFRRESESTTPVHMSLGALCKALNVGTTEMIPFIQMKLIRLVSAGHVSSQSTIEAVPESAVTWMRSWFQPAQAKPLFSLENAADLLNCTVREVLPLCAQYEIPAIRDPALGFTLSIWAMRMLLLRTVRGRDHTARFDRQALLWYLLQKDPAVAAEPPTFDQLLEDDLERVSKLDEPTRSLRTAQIWENLNDARNLAAGIANRETLASDRSQEISDAPQHGL